MAAADGYRAVNKLRQAGGGGQRRCVKHCRPHCNAHCAHPAVAQVKLQRLHAAGGLYRHCGARHPPAVIQVFCRTAQIICRHFALTAVAVEAAHFSVCERRVFQQYNAVPAHAKVLGAHLHTKRFRAGNGAVKIFNKRRVVATTLHFKKRHPLAGRAQVVDVHQLGVAFSKAAGKDVCQRARGVEGGQARDTKLHGTPVQRNKIAHRVVLHGAGVQQVAQGTAFHQPHDLVAFAGICHRRDRHPHLGNCRGGAAGGIQRKAKVVKALCQREHLLVIGGLDTDEHPGRAARQVARQLVPGRPQPFKQRFGHCFANTQHFAGRFHLRPQHKVGVAELFKREHRHLNRTIGRHRVQPRAVPQGSERVPQHHLCGKVDHRHAGHLADVGHGARRAGVDLNDIQFVLVNQVLDVDEPAGAQCQRQLLAAGADLLQHDIV